VKIINKDVIPTCALSIPTAVVEVSDVSVRIAVLYPNRMHPPYPFVGHDSRRLNQTIHYCRIASSQFLRES